MDSAGEKHEPAARNQCSCRLRNNSQEEKQKEGRDHHLYYNNFSFCRRNNHQNVEKLSSYQHCRHCHCCRARRREKVLLHTSHMDSRGLSQQSARTNHCWHRDCSCNIQVTRCEDKTANMSRMILSDRDYSSQISLNTNTSMLSGGSSEDRQQTSLMGSASSVNAASCSYPATLSSITQFLLKSFCLSVSRSIHSVSRSTHTLQDHVMACLAFLVCFVILNSQGASTYSAGGTLDFGIVIDAGSSGSRVRIYEWMYTRPGDIPQFREAFNHKVRPGISAFNTPEKDLSELDDYMDNLLQEAKDYIPYSQRERTPIFVMATAGKSDVILFISVLLKSVADPERGKGAITPFPPNACP